MGRSPMGMCSPSIVPHPTGWGCSPPHRMGLLDFKNRLSDSKIYIYICVCMYLYRYLSPSVSRWVLSMVTSIETPSCCVP